MATYKDVIGGLQIFAKYEGEDSPLAGAAHDVLWGPRREVSAEDAAALEKMGWFVSEEFECWSRFV